MRVTSGVGVTVPTALDTTKPVVSMTAPVNGAVASGLVNMATLASDNAAVAKVEFRVGGTLLLSDTTSPYAGTWDASAAAPGPHTITATAYDAAGNSTVASVGVTVPTPSDIASLVGTSGTKTNA